MFETLIWATDGSENADRALPLAKELARRDGARLIVLHCAEILAGVPGFEPRADEEDAEAKIRKQVSDLRAEGVNAKLVVVSGASAEVAYTIADVAAESDADVIVVGCRGHGPFGGALVGSVTQRLLHLAPCPVLAVPKTAQRRGNRKIGRSLTHA